MKGPRIIRSLGVEEKGRAGFFSYEDSPVPDGHFRVETLFSGLSAGTELTFLKGTNPYLHARWDEPYGVFVEGEPSASYPMPFLGYMEVGRVIESRVARPRVGDLVAMSYGHKTGHIAGACDDFYVVLPPGLDPMLGIFVAQMGPICANGLLHAAAEAVGSDVRSLSDGVAGRRILVMGGGVVGLLTALFARHAGAAAVIVADPAPGRQAHAEALGFEVLEEAQAWLEIKDRWHHGPGDRGADLVFQCRATGSALNQSLKALRPQGCVVDLAFYQDGAEAVRLGEEFHHNGLTIRCAQIGRVPRGCSFAWNRQRLAAETVSLLEAEGDAIRGYLVSHVVPFDDGPAFLAQLIRDRPDFLQAVFAFPPTGEA